MLDIFFYKEQLDYGITSSSCPIDQLIDNIRILYLWSETLF